MKKKNTKRNNKFLLKFSICIPSYNGENIIGSTISSILSQSFTNFNLIIVDDCSCDNTEAVVKSFKDKRVLFFRNENNVGYSKNLDRCRQKATGDILYLMGQDDILAKDALLNTYKAFMLSPKIGAVTRPYFWFDRRIALPVRAKDQLNPQQDEIVSIKDDYDRIINMFKTLDQLSGLAYRLKFMDLPFHQDIFPSHIYPFASIFKKYPIVFLKDYNIAVRIASSQTRSVSWIYDKSPIKSWVEMFNSVFSEKKFEKFRNYCIDNFVAVNYVGLVQIRNYARYRYLVREICLLLKYRWRNIFSFQFWFFSIGCLLMPAGLLIPMVDWYKNKIYARKLKNIKFSYSLKNED